MQDALTEMAGHQAVPAETGAAKERPRDGTKVYLILLALYVLCVVGYKGLRFAWMSLESDAVVLTQLSQGVYAESTVMPSGGAYPFGFVYPASNAFLSHLTGVPIETLQHSVQPFLVAMLVPIGFVAFRSLTGQPTVAMLASLLLLWQPEFVFEAVRSSHSKVTWMLAFIMVFILARSFGSTGSRATLVTWVTLFYLVAFALIASNSFFASNYIFGIGFASLGVHVLSRLRNDRDFRTPQLRRLSYVTVSCSVLAFLFIFYLYPPARQQFRDLQSIWDRLAALFLDVEVSQTVNPYQYVQATWVSRPVYLMLTSLNWILLGLSFTVWLRKAWLLLVRRQVLAPHALLLWLLYTSFAFLLALAVVLDVAGALSANLQVRLFPHLMVAGIPLASEFIIQAVSLVQTKAPAARRLTAVALVVVSVFFSLASLLKVTNEPLLSNQWTFHSNSEQRTVEWIGTHLRLARVWVGSDHRLAVLAEAFGGWEEQGVVDDRVLRGSWTRYVLVSSYLEANARRRERVVPDTRYYQRIYDGGDTQLHYSRPRTPFQR